MRVAVIGYFGHLNAGDDLLQAALAHALREHLLMFTSWYSPEILNQSDLVVVGGGGQWPESAFFRAGDWFARRLTAPLMVVGISATRADDEVRDRTLPLIDKAAFFHVRDPETREILGNHPGVVAGVDLFWWMPWNEAGDHDAPAPVRPATAALALRDWGLEAWDPRAVVATVRERCQVLPFPFHYGSMAGNPKSQVDDREFLVRLGLPEVPAAWTPEPARRADLTVAMRFHAVQVAVRFGKPVIGLDVDPKIRRFFDEHGVGELCVALGDPDALRDALARLAGDYPGYRRRFAGIRGRLTDRGASDLAAFRAALDSLGPRASAGRRPIRGALAALLGWMRS